MLNTNDSRLAFSKAEAFFGVGSFFEAIEQYNLVSIEDKNYSVAIENKSKAITEYKNTVLAQSETLAGTDDFEAAINILDVALVAFPDDVEFLQQHKIYLGQNIEKKITEAQTLAGDGEYRGAVIALRKLHTDNPNNTTISVALSDIEKLHINEMVASANDLEENENFNGALAVISEGQEFYPNDTSIINAIDSVHSGHVNAIVAIAENLAAENNFGEALKELTSGLRLYPDNSVLKSEIVSAESEHIETIILQAEALTAESNFDEALVLLNDTQKLYPDDVSLKNTIQLTNRIKPVRLTTDMSYTIEDDYAQYETRWVYRHSVLIDSNPDKYIEDCWMLENSNGSSYSENTESYRDYTLNREYNRIEGTFFLSFDGRSSNAAYQLCLYGDDILIHESEHMKTGVTPIKFSVNVSDVKNIRILIKRVDYNGDRDETEIGISNVLLYRKP